MIIKVGDFEFTEVWDGVLYKKLSTYPNITDWEIRNIIEFIQYEKMYGRECSIHCDNQKLLVQVNKPIASPDQYLNTPCPQLITECTACPYRKGCETKFVCHTTSIDHAISILESGKLLSALKARRVPVEVLMKEKRNATNDPADYFEYVMFAWGNCQAGDRLVMERKLGRFPDEKDLSTDFTPGIRFYFKYDHIKTHPNAVFDGVLPIKIKDEVVLNDWVDAIIVPSSFQTEIESVIPNNLKSRTFYIDNDCKDIWDWSEKVYSFLFV